MIKKLVLLFVLLSMVMLTGCSDKKSPGTFTISSKEKLTIGSTGTNLPLLKKLADAYMVKHKDVIIEIPVSLDTTGAVRNVREGNVDVGMISVALGKTDQKYLTETVFAKTIMIFAANPSVPVPGLTKKQIADIYLGKITNWREVGGLDRKIIVLAVEGERGKPTRLLVEKFIKDFPRSNIPSDAVIVRDYMAMNEGITSIRDSIGWTDLGAIKADDLKVKPLAIDGILPTVRNYQQGKYPMVKDLYILTRKQPRKEVQKFVNFVLGWEGKKIILDNGYLVPDQNQQWTCT